MAVTALVAGLLLSGFGEGQSARYSGTIAFVARTDNVADLYLITPDGKRRRQLTHDTREEGTPTWAPNGKSIAFVSTRFGVGPSHQDSISTISAISTTGSRRRSLFHARFGQLALNDLAWSPDGRRIAFTWFRNDRYQLWLLRVARRSIAPVATDAQQATWAPESRRLAYARIGGGVTVENVETREARRVSGTFESACPVWSPNGRWIAVCSKTAAGNNQFSALQLMTPAGLHRRELLKSTFVMPIAWTPKIDAIYLGADKRSASRRALFIVSLRNHHITRVPGTEGAVGSASWHR
jgi:Tol biopolymer transport system component